jgi:hypothetical protein
MRRWRRLVLAVGLLACPGLLVFLARPLPPPLLPLQPGVTPENFRRLHEGMSTGEVKAILGEPEERLHNSDTLFWVWKGEGCRIGIAFCVDAFAGELHTDDGQVSHLPSSQPPPSWDRLRGLLPW